MDLKAIKPSLFRGIVANIGNSFKNGSPVIADRLTKWQRKTVYDDNVIRINPVIHGFSNELD
jgi:hypothetical protein